MSDQLKETIKGISIKDFELKEDTQSLYKAVKDNPKDKIELELGDSKQPSKMYPQAKVMCCKVCKKELTNGNEVYCSRECKHVGMTGQIPWNRGVTGYSTAWKGRKHSKEAKEKMRKAKLGRKLSEKHKKKISESLKGRMPKNINTLDNSGENSHWWKGGVTDANELARKGKEFKGWRLKVFERDKYICQKCLKNTRDLHPHHILNFSEHKDKRFDIDNGVTLCGKHHMEFHSIYGCVGNNKKQLEEYLCKE